VGTVVEGVREGSEGLAGGEGGPAVVGPQDAEPSDHGNKPGRPSLDVGEELDEGVNSEESRRGEERSDAERRNGGHTGHPLEDEAPDGDVHAGELGGRGGG
jgi:hypothetical protein